MTDSEDVLTSEAQAIMQFAERLGGAEFKTVQHKGADGNAVLAVLPEGKTIQDLKPLLDKWLPAPERVEGTATLATLDGFIAHANRFKQLCTAIYGQREMTSPSLTAVYDYHDAGLPAFCKHRAHYPMPLSPEWQAWNRANTKLMTQDLFAAFIEDNIKDCVVVDPQGIARAASAAPEDVALAQVAEMVRVLHGELGLAFASPGRLVQLSRGLKAHVKDDVASEVNLASGEGEIAWKTKHEDSTGAPLKVPGAFVLSIPVFDGGPRDLLAARLRYRIVEGKVQWAYELYRSDVVFRAAFDAAAARAVDETGLPLFLGAPE